MKNTNNTRGTRKYTSTKVTRDKLIENVLNLLDQGMPMRDVSDWYNSVSDTKLSKDCLRMRVKAYRNRLNIPKNNTDTTDTTDTTITDASDNTPVNTTNTITVDPTKKIGINHDIDYVDTGKGKFNIDNYPSDDNIWMSRVDQPTHLSYKADNQEFSFDKKIFFNPGEAKTPENILSKLGYDSEFWALSSYTLGAWDVATRNDMKECYTIRAKIKPKASTDMMLEDYASIVKASFSSCKPLSVIQPNIIDKARNMFGKLSSYRSDARNSSNNTRTRLLEIPPIELHYGKVGSCIETGNVYDDKVARSIFNNIFDTIIRANSETDIDEVLVVIGSDFFNSEASGTTTKGTPQSNCLSYKQMFIDGLEMYEHAILSLFNKFKNVKVMLCAGNHARSMEFFLFVALQQRFSSYAPCKMVSSGGITFIENYRDTQAYVYGNNAIFFNHGDINLKRTIKSIPAEFPQIWGKCLFRELHLGHLHKEVTVDDEGGMITRRIGSPCGNDDWHYVNRFLGSVKKHQIFIWDYEKGLETIRYINV
jgi:hypothetical protein